MRRLLTRWVVGIQLLLVRSLQWWLRLAFGLLDFGSWQWDLIIFLILVLIIDTFCDWLHYSVITMFLGLFSTSSHDWGSILHCSHRPRLWSSSPLRVVWIRHSHISVPRVLTCPLALAWLVILTNLIVKGSIIRALMRGMTKRSSDALITANSCNFFLDVVG